MIAILSITTYNLQNKGIIDKHFAETIEEVAYGVYDVLEEEKRRKEQ